MSERGREAVRADDDVVPAAELHRLEARVRDHERLLGHMTSLRCTDTEGSRRQECGAPLSVAILRAGDRPTRRIASNLSRMIHRCCGAKAANLIDCQRDVLSVAKFALLEVVWMH